MFRVLHPQTSMDRVPKNGKQANKSATKTQDHKKFQTRRKTLYVNSQTKRLGKTQGKNGAEG